MVFKFGLNTLLNKLDIFICNAFVFAFDIKKNKLWLFLTMILITLKRKEEINEILNIYKYIYKFI